MNIKHKLIFTFFCTVCKIDFMLLCSIFNQVSRPKVFLCNQNAFRIPNGSDFYFYSIMLLLPLLPFIWINLSKEFTFFGAEKKEEIGISAKIKINVGKGKSRVKEIWILNGMLNCFKIKRR